MKLIEVFTLFFVAVILVNSKNAAEIVDNGKRDTSNEKQSKDRPFYGDQSHPAKSCREIFKQMPNLPSGVYWLDVYDWERHRTVQERHYCQNTVANETQTGHKLKGQKGEIGVEDLSIGKPDPEPFDWEELTNENWPLPITPPTEEEMRQRLQKQIQDYRKKMKNKNPGKSGPNLIGNSRNTERQVQQKNNTLQDSAFQNSSVQGTVALSSVEGGKLTFKKNASTGYIHTDNSVIGSSAEEERAMNKTDVYPNLANTLQNTNPIKSETNQSWFNGNLVNYVPLALNATEYTASQVNRDLPSAKGSLSLSYNGASLYNNLQNPDYLNIRNGNAGFSSQNQDHYNQNIAFRNCNESANAVRSDNNTNLNLFYSSNENSSKFENDSAMQQSRNQEIHVLNSTGILGHDFNNISNLENQSFSMHGNLLGSRNRTTDNLTSDQKWTADDYNSTLAASPTHKYTSLYGNLKQDVVGNITSSQSDSNRFLNSSYLIKESILKISDQTASVIGIEIPDRNPGYDLNTSFAISPGNKKLNQNWINISRSNESIFPVDKSGYINGSSSGDTNRTTAQVSVGWNGNLISEYLSAWNRAGINSSGLRNDSLRNNPAAQISADNLRPNLYPNPEKAANDSLNIIKASYTSASIQGNPSTFTTSTNDASAQLSNPKSDYDWNPGYTFQNNTVGLIANTSTADNIRSNQYWNAGYTFQNNTVGLIANTSTADNIRSNQYWNPGYGNSTGKQTNGSLSYSDGIRSDLYWNPGYENNRSADLKSNESSLNSQSYYLQSLNLYWNQSYVSETVDRSTNGTTDASSIVKEYYSSSDVVDAVNSTSVNKSKNETFSHYNSFNSSENATSFDTLGHRSVFASNQAVSASNNHTSAGIQSDSAGNQGVSASNQAASSSNNHMSAGIQSDSAGNQSASASNQVVFVSNNRTSAGIQSDSAGNQSVSASNQAVTASNENISTDIKSASAGNRNISAGSQAVESSGNVSYNHGYENATTGSTSSYNVGNTSDDIKTSIINGTETQPNDTALENKSNMLMRNTDVLYKQANDVQKSAANTVARKEIVGRRHNLLHDKHGNLGHSRVRMILKNWSKITSDGNKAENTMDMNTAKVVTTEKEASITRKNSAAAKDISNKDLERDGLFVKPGLNIGVIETTKDLKNESKRKDTVARWKNKSTNSPVNVVKISAQASTGSKRTVVLHGNDQTISEKISEDSPAYTGQATDISPSPAGDPVKKPNPDELNRGLWTDEAIKYADKANEDFAKQMKYLSQHGGTMNDLIWENNKLKENKQVTRDPTNADATKEKMKDFFARNKEILTKGGGLPSDSPENKVDNSVPKNPKQYMKMSSLRPDKGDQAKKPDSSIKLGLSSSTSSETGSESQSEAWADVGTNTESFTGADGGSVPAEDEFEDGEPQWENNEAPSYEGYDRPQGLGLWTDSNTGTGVGISTGTDDGTGPEAESEFGAKESSMSSWPSFGFSNGFGMGMNAGSQSGSETMTETSVGINTGTSTETSSKTESKTEANPGSKTKSKYKWKAGPKINSFGEEKDSYTEKSNAGIDQGYKHPSQVAKTMGGGLHTLVAPIAQDVKEKAKFRPSPQLGIQVDSNVNTKVQASASAQTGSGNNSGRKKKPKSKPKTVSQINMEKAKERLKKQMKKHQEDLEESTRNNPLHRWKFGDIPMQARLEAIVEKTRKIPLGIRIGGTNGKEAGTESGKDKNRDPNKVEASVDIQYEGENTKGVNIEAGVSTKIGGGGSRPRNDTLKNSKGYKNYQERKDWRSLYKWYQKYPFSIPSIAEINKKLNSMPYALYKVRMRKPGKRDV